MCEKRREGFDVVWRVFYHRCHERKLMAALYALTAEAHGSNCRTESSASSLLHFEFPPSWLKYQHIAAIFPSTRAHSFNNLQNEGGWWEVIWVTCIRLISGAKDAVLRADSWSPEVCVNARCVTGMCTVCIQSSIHVKKYYIYYVYSMIMWRKNNNK